MAHETIQSTNIRQGDSDVSCAKTLTPHPLPDFLDIMAIPLSQGLFALVDGDDYEWLMQWKWHAHQGRKSFYAARNESGGMVLMHRQILNAPIGMETDHIYHNGLDNRRDNIRLCTPSQNQANQNRRGGTSVHKGVSWREGKNIWRAQIECNRKVLHIGSYHNELDAAKAYDKKAKELFGDFAYLNFGAMK